MFRTPFLLIAATALTLPALAASSADATTPTPQATGVVAAATDTNPYTATPTTVYAHGHPVIFDGPGHLPYGTRTIDYGDGETDEWANPQSASPTGHAYAKPGTYSPVVHQEIDGTWVDFPLPDITVLKDTVAPVATLVIPKQHTVKAWSTVTVNVVEKETYPRPKVRIWQQRGGDWYGYQGLDGWKWAPTQAKARKAAYAIVDGYNADGTVFTRKVHGLIRGHLYVELTCTDAARNVGKPTQMDVVLH